MLRIMSEWTWDIDEELCACFTDWQKACDWVTYLLTPWSRVLLEKLTVNFAASQEIPRIYGTRTLSVTE
jgi:hypothetical protein